MGYMNNSNRERIVSIAKVHGFQVQLKPNYTDLYDKNLVFKSPDYESLVFIDRETGINRSNGNLEYLKVAVHPDAFRSELIDPDYGIDDFQNRRSKINRHSHSNYIGFTRFEGNVEPCAKCYKVDGFDALGLLFKGLRGA